MSDDMKFTEPETVLKICDSHNGLLAAARAEGERAGREEMQATFDLRWQASQRAIERWREAHPDKALVRPDHADLCVWLLEQLDGAERTGFDRAANAIRGLWPHIEVAAGPRSYDKSKIYDPGAPTCLRCKIEEAINVAR